MQAPIGATSFGERKIKRIRELIDYRELMWNIIVRELKVKYKNSILGFFWALLEPLMTILVYVIVFSIIVKFDIPDYPVFLLTAILPWSYLIRGLNGTVNVFPMNRSLLQKIYFPRTILPLAIVVTHLVNFLLTLLVFGPVLIYFRSDGLSIDLIWLPVIILAQTLFILGISLVASVANAFYRDAGYALQVITRFWFYACPIFYSLEMVQDASDKLYSLYMFNPMAVFIGLYRVVLLQYPLPDIKYLVLTGIITMMFLVFGLWMLGKYENNMVKQL